MAMQSSFSITRLLVAVGVCAGAGVITEPLGVSRLLAAAVNGLPIAVIVLIARKRDIWPIVRMLLWCGGGALIAVFFSPAVQRPYDAGDEYIYGIAGAVLAFVTRLAFELQSPGNRPRSQSVENVVYVSNQSPCAHTINWTWERIGIRICPFTGEPTLLEHKPVVILDCLQLTKVAGGRVHFYELSGRAIVVVNAATVDATARDIRNASRQSGWDVDVYTAAMLNHTQERAAREFASIDGIDPELAETLIANGYFGFDDLSAINPSVLMQLGRLDMQTAEEIIEQAEVNREARA